MIPLTGLLDVHIERTRDGGDVVAMSPYFQLEDEPQAIRHLFIKILVSRITEDNLLVLKATHGDDLVGFLIAETKGGGSPYAKIVQVWIKPGMPSCVGRRLLAKTILWANAHGCVRLRGETVRNPEGFFRKYNFRVVKHVIEHQINPSLIDMIEENLEGGL
jgi:hypothetical protein